MSSLVAIYGFALLGGIILNVMPCVLPVLTMKVFHVIEQAKEAPSVNRRHGVAYSLGILLFFAGIAAIVIAAKVAGERLLWGQQFQNPIFVVFVTTLIFVFALNALGVFEFTVGMSVEGGSGYKGSMINGLVAAVMATPCSAPFLGGALPIAFNPETSAVHTAGIFLTIGLGLALPFILISFVPALAKMLPRPGAWMTTFKQLMGFTLMGAAIWLYSTVQTILSPGAAINYLSFLLVLGIVLWGYGKWGGPEHSERRRWLVRGLSLGLSVVAGLWLLDLTPHKKSQPGAMAVAEAKEGETPQDPPVVLDGKINWVPFDEETIKTNLDRGRPVFMDFTADWCANCKTNEKLFIETETIRDVLQATNILPMKADFTNEDEEIEQWIEDLGRAGIPIYVVLYPDGHRDLLPESITTSTLSAALEKASQKYPPEKMAPPSAPKPKKASTDTSDDVSAEHAIAGG